MNVYDLAHGLARALKESDEFAERERLRLVAYSDDTNRALLDEFKKLQIQAQVRFASGERPPDDDMDRLSKISALLQYNADTSAYVLADFRYQKLLADIYKILGETAGIDLDMLHG